MDRKYKEISYEEWLKIIKNVKDNGLKDESYDVLINNYPRKLDVRSIGQLLNQIAELEIFLLKSAFKKFEKCLNEAIYENDMEFIEISVARFIRDLSRCLFFNYMDCITNENKMNLQNDICLNVSRFQKDIEYFLKKSSIDDGGYFIQDILYVLQKRNIARDILEWRLVL